MTRVRNIGFILAVNLVVSIAFPGQAFSALPGYVDADAERVSQYINKADAKRMDKQANLEDAAKRTAENADEPDLATQKPKRVSVKRNAGWLQSSSPTLKVSIPDTENRAVWLSRGNSPKMADSFIVNLPVTKNTVDAKVSSDGSVVYSGYQQATDIAVQPFDDSVRILTVLNGTDSPSEYAYKVNLPAGGKIEKMENGGVLVLDSQGSLIGGFAPPWAVDNTGKSVQTHYDVRGNQVVQVVDHLDGNVSYPVVADPWLGKALISYAVWTKYIRYGIDWGFSLFVYPTAWARVNVLSYNAGVAGWNELLNRYKDTAVFYTNFDHNEYETRGIKNNLSGLRNQYLCHAWSGGHPLKGTWQLEEFRPDVGWLKTVAATCNPGNP